jgi:hypothetical protein
MTDNTPIPDDVAATFDETARRYLNFRRQRDEMGKLMDKEKAPLNEILEQYGEKDANGHRTLEIDPPVHGIDALTRQRKVAHLQDDAKAEAIARALGLYERLFKPVMTLDEDAVMVAHEQGLLTDKQVEQMFPQRITHALMPRKAKS